MSVERHVAPGPVPADAGANAGLWSEQWFRILTTVNVSIVLASAVTGLAMVLGARPPVLGWFLVALPVVPATVAIPLVSLGIVLAAAALSTLNMIGEKHKAARFLRAMTVWGAIVLILPLTLTLVVALISAVSALVVWIGALW